MDFKLLINNRGTIYDATELCEGEISLETQRRGSPAKLSFKILRYENINYQEGNEVVFSVKDNVIFRGYIFKKSRTKEQIIDTTAYDQLIYLKKNKDTYVYKNKKASEIVQMIADDYKIKTGTVTDTGYVIPNRSEDIQTLMDIIYNAIDLTVINTGNLFVLYDSAGELTLKNIEEMKLNKLISADNTLIDYQYTTDIDSETYNSVKLVRDMEKTKIRESYVAMDSNNIDKWGLLQYHEKVDENLTEAQIIDLANKRLALYNKVKRTLSVEDLAGDFSVRAGNSVLIDIPSIGDISIKQWLMIDKCTHSIKENEHRMKLDLIGL